jgi:hypothetical protein
MVHGRNDTQEGGRSHHQTFCLNLPMQLLLHLIDYLRIDLFVPSAAVMHERYEKLSTLLKRIYAGNKYAGSTEKRQFSIKIKSGPRIPRR